MDLVDVLAQILRAYSFNHFNGYQLVVTPGQVAVVLK